MTMRRDNLLREPASRGWPRVSTEPRSRPPEAADRQGAVENDFRCADAFAAQPQVFLEAAGASCVRGKSVWPEAYWTAGTQH
ncbi:hypothetical protein PO909_001869 [Leuciscus waleckii]